MSTIREKIMMAIEELTEVLERLDRVEVTPTATEPTDEEISLNVAGVPDLHITKPEQFAKMAKYYDPEKEPFTSSTWMTMGMVGADARPYKVTERDGQPFQRTNPQAGPDWYWISKGVSDVTAEQWNALEIKYDQPEEVKIEYFRNYKGGYTRSISTWPESYLKAYEEGRA